MRQAITRLNDCKLRATPTRIGVLQLLEKMQPTNLDADQIFKLLLKHELDACPATIYRTLRELVTHQLIFKDRDGDGAATYRMKPADYDEKSITVSFESSGDNFSFIDAALREHVLKSLQQKKLISTKNDVASIRIVLSTAA